MNTRRVAFLIGCLWLALLACGCSKVSEAPQLGTNTKWLKTCSKQSECGARRSCVCGVCTSACSADAQCAAVHGETRCQSVSGTACEGTHETTASACLQGCRADDDCSALQNGRCADGLCVPVLGAEPTPSGSATEPTPSGSATEPAPGASNVDPDYALKRVDADVVITSAYTECERDSECALVGTSCNGCCELGAIHARLSDTYGVEHERACSDYRGAECDCDFRDLVARCEAGRCRTVPRDTSACFSPSQNLEQAFEEGTIGCRCRPYGATLCTGRAWIQCGSDVGPLSAWNLSSSRSVRAEARQRVPRRASLRQRGGLPGRFR